MAYQRPSVISQQVIQKNWSSINYPTNNSNYYSVNDIMESDDEEQEEEVNLVKEKYNVDYHPVTTTHHPSSKSLIIMNTIDISHWSPVLQFVILTSGLILFMCLYGYCQELVIYGWFNRKLSIFSTFLHFLGCSLFAQLHRNITKQSSNYNAHIDSSSSTLSVSTFPPFLRPMMSLFSDVLPHCSCPHLSMGSASPSVALGYYVLLVLTKTLAQGLSNLSMSQINYPAKVLFKSANPIVTILIGIVWFRKQYPIRDYIVVIMLVIGLYIFMMGDTWYASVTSGEIDQTIQPSTALGIFYVILSMFGSAGVPMIQEYCITMYHASVDDLVYYIYLGSTVISFVLAVASNELVVGIQFLIQNSSWSIWMIFVCFCTFGFIGSNFSTMITQQYGALVNGILNTFRKAVTIALSFLLFPERNKLNTIKVFGTIIFFAGLVIRIVYKSSSASVGTGHLLMADTKKHCDEDVEQIVNAPEASGSSAFLENSSSRKRTSPRKRSAAQSLQSVDLESRDGMGESDFTVDNTPQHDSFVVTNNYQGSGNISMINDSTTVNSSRDSNSRQFSNNISIMDMKMHKTMIL